MNQALPAEAVGSTMAGAGKGKMEILDQALQKISREGAIMSEIHYFPRYSQAENVVTNNTLLLLLRLYQYNRFKFEKFMEALCAEQDIEIGSSWLKFLQQKGTGKSVLDGFIAQDSIKIAVETKLTDAFDLLQLQNHLAVFGTERHKLLVLLSPSAGAVSASQLASIRACAMPRNIQVMHTSFEEVVKRARNCLSEHDEEMLALVDDYESFCSDTGLLPRDEYTLFAPPCGWSSEENIEFRLYYCPTTRSLRKACYLGVYANKTVKAIGRIGNVVACDVDLSADKVTVNEATRDLTKEEEQRILGACRKGQQRDWDLRRGHKFFVCDELVETDFRKTSPGGIMGHRYFDLEKILASKIPKSIDELASLLRGRTWE